MNSFCTIIDTNYIAFANTLFSSIRNFNSKIKLNVLLIGELPESDTSLFSEGIVCDPVGAVLETDIAKSIFKKYAATNKDHLRWALKPVFINYLLSMDQEKVIFVDPDIYFVGDFNFLFAEIDNASLLLTPHWNTINPFEFEDGIFSIMRNGMFNAGFIGANRKGIPAIQWWAGMCHYKMDRQVELGVYDDQKYLDILPIEFPDTKILQHRGCNLASWNLNSNKREIINGMLLINKTYKPVFIHFAKDTIENIQNGNDNLLAPFLDSYCKSLENEGFDISKMRNKKKTFYQTIKRKLLLRTRLKRFLFKLVEKL